MVIAYPAFPDNSQILDFSVLHLWKLILSTFCAQQVYLTCPNWLECSESDNEPCVTISHLGGCRNFKRTTQSPEIFQKFFSHALMHLYGFNFLPNDFTLLSIIGLNSQKWGGSCPVSCSALLGSQERDICVTPL